MTRRTLLCTGRCGATATHVVGDGGPLVLVLCPDCRDGYQQYYEGLNSRPIRRYSGRSK
jgi:hypothetical protein